MNNKIKIGVWILSEYKPQAGGGFSLYDRLIRMIDDYNFPDDIEICFVGHKPASDFKFKKKYVPVYFLFINMGFIRELVTKFSHKFKFIGKAEGNILKRNKIDLIYYPVQGFRKVNGFPFVSANWDIGHLSTYAFPEFASNNRFEFREKWYSKEIFKALMVFAESEAGKDELIQLTGLNPERIGIVPLIAGGITDLAVSENSMNDFLKQYNINAGKFFFYPAQFWAHKNHYNLLVAFRKFVKEFPDTKLVLTGSDKGNKKYIMDSVLKLGIGSNVIFTGFISDECLFSFYKKALALVFPGLLGPTNMPLLEAALLNCPVICTDLKGHKEMMKDGALYFNGLDADSIYEHFKYIVVEANRNDLLLKANNVLKSSTFTAENAMKSFVENFSKLKNIRNSWGENDKIF